MLINVKHSEKCDLPSGARNNYIIINDNIIY